MSFATRFSRRRAGLGTEMAAAQAHVFASGDAPSDALRRELALRLHLLDPSLLEALPLIELQALRDELDADDAETAAETAGLGAIDPAELEAQALAAASDTAGAECAPQSASGVHFQELAMQDDLTHILESAQTVAVVGMSDRHDRPSYQVAHYLQAAGYRIVPVNPLLVDKGEKVLGETPYADLQAAARALADAGEQPIDLVDVFRRSEDVLPVAEQAIAIGAKTLWLQLDVHNPEAEHAAAAAGLNVVVDRCTKIEHARRGLQRAPHFAG